MLVINLMNPSPMVHHVRGSAQPVKYVFVKGTCVIFSNSEKAIVLDRETGNNLTAVQDAPTVSEPSVLEVTT